MNCIELNKIVSKFKIFPSLERGPEWCHYQFQLSVKMILTTNCRHFYKQVFCGFFSPRPLSKLFLDYFTEQYKLYSNAQVCNQNPDRDISLNQSLM